MKSTWLTLLATFGRLLFSLAIIGIGVETLICSYVVSQPSVPHSQVLPVIPWLPTFPILAYVVGAIFSLCGAAILLRRKLVTAPVVFGLLMLLCALAFDLPRRPNLLSAEWRTNLLEPIALGSLAWLMPDLAGIPEWLQRTARYLLAFVFIVFGIAHFQVLTFIAGMVPAWIPWPRFWTLFFGLAFVCAGLSFATGLLQRWAALGLGLMFALWLITIHLPPLLHAPHDPHKWSDVFIVAALSGGLWPLADALRDRHNPRRAGRNRAYLT
jgi:uncharacterized membrane protein YphA (DoxX/SURF4 family)